MPRSNIWCPFDISSSLFVKHLTRNGFDVTYSHLSLGQDFFELDPPDQTDYIISNPPYSKKGEVLQRLFDIGLPFAMLVGVVGLFESKTRFKMFSQNDFEIMYFDRRISYLKSYDDSRPLINPPFSSVFVCHRILPKQIVFEVIAKQ